MRNTLFYSDNLDVLREQVADESVDLIYLDPPFNSARNYNLLFKQVKGESSPAQIMAFEDTWQWSPLRYVLQNAGSARRRNWWRIRSRVKGCRFRAAATESRRGPGPAGAAEI